MSQTPGKQTSLWALRVQSFDAVSLRWFFCDSDAAMGLSSNLGKQLERMNLGGRNKGSKPLGPAHAVGLSNAKLEAAMDARGIERRLLQLRLEDLAILRVHYGPLLPLHRQHEPTHTGKSSDPTDGPPEPGAHPRDQPLQIFGDKLALVLYLAVRDASGNKPAEKVVEAVIEAARRSTQSKGGQQRSSARGKVGAWLALAETALARASSAYAVTRFTVGAGAARRLR